jgi:predicted nucleic acid-binding protein
MPNKWVVKASPLIVLARINHLFLLQHVAEELVVPAGVAQEIAQGLKMNRPGNGCNLMGRNWFVKRR